MMLNVKSGSFRVNRSLEKKKKLLLCLFPYLSQFHQNQQQKKVFVRCSAGNKSPSPPVFEVHTHTHKQGHNIPPKLKSVLLPGPWDLIQVCAVLPPLPSHFCLADSLNLRGQDSFFN